MSDYREDVFPLERENKPQENKMGVLPIPQLLIYMAVPLMLSMLVQAC